MINIEEMGDAAVHAGPGRYHPQPDSDCLHLPLSSSLQLFFCLSVLLFSCCSLPFPCCSLVYEVQRLWKWQNSVLQHFSQISVFTLN